MQTTLEVLGRRGYAGLRVEDVAAAAGVNKTTIYRRWPTRPDLVVAALTSIAPPPTAAHTGRLECDLRATFVTATTLRATPAGRGVVRVLIEERGDPDVDRVVATVREYHRAPARTVLQRARRRGELPARVDIELLLDILTGTIFSRLRDCLHPLDPAWVGRVVRLYLPARAPAGVSEAVTKRSRALSILATVAVLAGLPACRKQQAEPPPPPPTSVTFVTVTPEEVPIISDWLATLDGYVNAQIRPQVSGYLLRRVYREGAFVRKGDLLFEIDRRPFEAALLSVKAALAQSQSDLAKAERDVARDKPLAEQRAIAQSQYDNDLSARDAAQASVASAQAAIDVAQLNLSFTRVTSLIDGLAAIATAQIGDLVGPTTLLTTVSQVDPIKAYFPINEQDTSRSPAGSAHLGRRRGSGSKAADSR